MKLLKFIASILIAMLVAASTPAAPASAATGGDPGNCPESTNGNGGLLTDVSVDMLLNDYRDIVVKSNEEVHIICVSSPAQGWSGVGYDGTVYYGSWSGPLDVDSFIVGFTDEDKYYSASVNVNLERTTFETPVVTQKLKRKNGKVLKRGWLKVSNTTLRGEQIMAGSFNEPQPDVTKDIAAGASKVIRTKRSELDFMLFVINDDGYPVFVSAGHANMRTGVVTMEQDLSYRGTSAARTKVASPRWGTTR